MIGHLSLLEDGEELKRKFLIKYPDIDKLEAFPNVRIVDIKQEYLPVNGNVVRRIKEIVEENEHSYVYTEKIRVSDIAQIRADSKISYEDYNKLKEEVSSKYVILKKRYYLYNNSMCFQVDVYPQWSDRAVVEVALNNEDDEFDLPDILDVMYEVTKDPRYRNEYNAYYGFDF